MFEDADDCLGQFQMGKRKWIKNTRLMPGLNWKAGQNLNKI